MKAGDAHRCLILMLTILVWIYPSYAQPECICHSKQPAMKHMHEIIGLKDCGNCHSGNENLMSAGNRRVDDPKERSKERFKTDAFCVPCHDSEGLVKMAGIAHKSHQNISGTFFCPKDGLRYPADIRSCPECGAVLINISELMERSRMNPSNDICKQCHLMERTAQIENHGMFKTDRLEMCLDCHEGHDDCSSCHY